MPSCFVIMPYGGDEEAKRNHYLGVYQGILLRAAIEAGFKPEEVKRSDIHGTLGNIPKEIVQDLVTADIVIADLSEGNANVFWELGVRHVLRKGGTVSVINANDRIPFDLAAYRVVKYDTSNFLRVQEVVTEIAKQIKARLANSDTSDNPVHDNFPQLPRSYLFSEDDRTKDLEERVKRLSEENDGLKKRVRELDPTDAYGRGASDILGILAAADQQHRSTSENKIIQLAGAVQQGKKGETLFIERLRNLLQNPFITASEFLQIRQLCRQMSLSAYEQAVMKIAYDRFPADSSIFKALIATYNDAPTHDEKMKGLRLIERHLDIERDDSNDVVRLRRVAQASISNVGMLFNFYMGMAEWGWIITIADQLAEKARPDELAFLLRNKANALAKSLKYEEALDAYERSIEIKADDQTMAWYADFLDDLGRYEDSYSWWEKSYLADKNDFNRFVQLANHIILRGVVKNDDCGYTRDVPHEERLKYAMPLYIYALRRNPQLTQRVISALVNAKAVEEATDISQGMIPQGEYNTSALNCLLALAGFQPA